MANVLVVDDDPKILAADGPSALAEAHRLRPDLVLLDVLLPGLDGFEVCRQLRESSDVPILLLTARSGESDKVVGLDLGADDYIVKPFSPRELMARVRAHLRRRPASKAEPLLVAGELVLDPNAVEVQLEGRPVELTPFEFRLLHVLMRRPGRAFTRDELINAIHGDDDPGILDRTVDVHLGRLRSKLGEQPASPRYVATVRTVGYKFVASVERQMAEA